MRRFRLKFGLFVDLVLWNGHALLLNFVLLLPELHLLNGLIFFSWQRLIFQLRLWGIVKSVIKYIIDGVFVR